MDIKDALKHDLAGVVRFRRLIAFKDNIEAYIPMVVALRVTQRYVRLILGLIDTLVIGVESNFPNPMSSGLNGT